jgi:hypothetical protein
MARNWNRGRLLGGAALLVGGALAGGLLAGTLTAGAATTSPSPSETSATAGPGVQENDGIPESQEHHGDRGHGLDLTGTVTAVGRDSVTIKTPSGTTTYTVDSTSDIDKNGEAQLPSLATGDAVRYSVRNGTTTIDKLHAGDESKNFPGGGPDPSSSSGA